MILLNNRKDKISISVDFPEELGPKIPIVLKSCFFISEKSIDCPGPYPKR